MIFNQTSDDFVVKTTINIPKDLMSAAVGRMKRLGINFFSVYIRALILRDVESQNPMSLGDFLHQNDQYQLFEENKEPPRKYHGFGSGLAKSSFILNWFRKKNRN